MLSKTPGLEYAFKGNIRFPGTQAQADAAERKGEDVAEAYLGFVGNELANTAVITIAV